MTPTKPTLDSNSNLTPNASQASTEASMAEFDNHQTSTPVPPRTSHHVTNNVPPTLVKPAVINISMFTSTSTERSQPNLAVPPSIPNQNEAGWMKVAQIHKNIITFRYKLKVEKSTYNLPFMVKQVTCMLLEIDPSIHILQFNSTDCNHVLLDHEDSLPTEEDKIKTWVQEVSTWKDRLHFTIKYAFIKEKDALKCPVFSWMKANSSYVKMDQIGFESINCVEHSDTSQNWPWKETQDTWGTNTYVFLLCLTLLMEFIKK